MASMDGAYPSYCHMKQPPSPYRRDTKTKAKYHSKNSAGQEADFG